jgi:hypothetical protein
VKPIAFIAGAGTAYLIYRGISSKTKGPKRAQTEEELHKIPSGHNLSAEVDFTVSSGLFGEKTLASPEYIKNKVAPAVKVLRTIICEHMPVLADVQPEVIVKDINTGYTIRINWPATFIDNNRGDVSTELRDCIYAGVKSKLDSDTRKRITRFRIFRD